MMLIGRPDEQTKRESNSSRPKHGLDQLSLVSDPNVDINLKSFSRFPLGLQDSVVSMTDRFTATAGVQEPSLPTLSATEMVLNGTIKAVQKTGRDEQAATAHLDEFPSWTNDPAGTFLTLYR
jgi:hypothetical protein